MKDTTPRVGDTVCIRGDGENQVMEMALLVGFRRARFSREIEVAFLRDAKGTFRLPFWALRGLEFQRNGQEGVYE